MWVALVLRRSDEYMRRRIPQRRDRELQEAAFGANSINGICRSVLALVWKCRQPIAWVFFFFRLIFRFCEQRYIDAGPKQKPEKESDNLAMIGFKLQCY